MATTKRAAVGAPAFFATGGKFRAWLNKNAASADVLIVGFYKVGSGKPSMTWPESVDEALCHGWIDGVRKRIDAHAYQIRFSPRKPSSIWSTVNITRAQALIAEGRMTAAGHAAFAKRTERKSSVYAYEQKGMLQLAPAQIAAFKKNKAAWRHYESLAPRYRKTMTYWVVSAKQHATRTRRLSKLIEACAAGKRLLP
jgi:uncharacterized protein YdeI (YjbR/CyaY-like superfamily)